MKRLLFVVIAAMGCTDHGGGDDTAIGSLVAHDDHLQTAEDTQLAVSEAVLANDENVSNYAYGGRIVPVDKPLHGYLSSSSLYYTYYPDPGYHGPDHFTYKLGDSIAAVDIDVQSDGVPYEQSVQVDGGPTASLVAGDLDGDGRTDLAAIDTDTHSVIAMLNGSTPGHYAFDVQRFEGGHTPVALALADVDGDGALDVITAAGSDGVVVMRNATSNGILSFDAPVLLAAGYATAVATADIDRDGRPDVLATDRTGDQLIVRLDRSTPGTVAFDDVAYGFATAAGPTAVQAVDIDHSGGVDIVVLCDTAATLSLFSNATAIGDQVPAFTSRVDRQTGADPGQLVTGDLDGDGAPELVVVQPEDSTLRVFNNTGTTFSGARVDPLDYAGPTGAGIVDLDHAGGLDLIVGYGNALEQLISGASYTLSPVDVKVGLKGSVVTPEAVSTILQVDLDGAGTPELVIASDTSFYNQGFKGTLVVYGD